MASGSYIDYSSSRVMQKQLAELYERMYPYAAEDFTNEKDSQTRQDNVDNYITELHQKLNQLLQWIQSHTHTTISIGSPTSPPVGILMIFWPNIPVTYSNTTLAEPNFENGIIPFQYLSYIDERDGVTDKNQSQAAYRRSKQILINTQVLTPPLIRR